VSSSINEETLRALVRETIARIGAPQGGHEHHDHRVQEPVPLLMHSSSHVSHYRYTLPPSGGPCQIEPGVPCQHCGYCESHGH